MAFCAQRYLLSSRQNASMSRLPALSRGIHGFICSSTILPSPSTYSRNLSTSWSEWVILPTADTSLTIWLICHGSFMRVQMRRRLSHDAPPDELDTWRCIGLAVNTVEAWHASSAEAHACVTPQGSVSSTNVGLLRRLILRGVGITVLPEVMVRNETENGSLVRLLPAWHGSAGICLHAKPPGAR